MIKAIPFWELQKKMLMQWVITKITIVEDSEATMNIEAIATEEILKGEEEIIEEVEVETTNLKGEEN